MKKILISLSVLFVVVLAVVAFWAMNRKPVAINTTFRTNAEQLSTQETLDAMNALHAAISEAERTVDLKNAFLQARSDGSLKSVSASDGLTCTISSGANAISADLECTSLIGLAPGNAYLAASLGKWSIVLKISVDQDLHVTIHNGSDVDADGHALVDLSEGRLVFRSVDNASPAFGAIEGQNFVVGSSQVRDTSESFFQAQGNGQFKRISTKDGLQCSILREKSTKHENDKVKIVGNCVIEGKSPGCAKMVAKLDGSTFTSIIRVTNPDGSGEYCPD
jgi:hypothetical protein